MTPAEAATRLLSLLWDASWQGGVLVAVLWTGCRLLRVPPRFAALLWWGVLLKFTLSLLVPVIFGEHALLRVPISHPDLAFLFSVRQVASPVGSYLPATQPLLQGLAILWCLGICLSLLLVLWRIVGARRTAASSQTVPAEMATPLKDETQYIAVRLGLSARQVPEIRVSSVATEQGPRLLAALPRPLILFPGTLLPPSEEAIDDQERRLVLAHELAHVRRGDLWLGLLPVLTRCLFFFHPLVYLAHQEWEAAREEACDAMALALDGESSMTTARYGALLLRLSSAQTGRQMEHSAVRIGLLPSPLFHALRRRLNHLEQQQTGQAKRSRVLLPLFQVATLLILSITLLPIRPEFIPYPVAQAIVVTRPVMQAEDHKRVRSGYMLAARGKIREVASAAQSAPSPHLFPPSPVTRGTINTVRPSYSPPLVLLSSKQAVQKTAHVSFADRTPLLRSKKATLSDIQREVHTVVPTLPQSSRPTLPVFTSSEPELAMISNATETDSGSVGDIPPASAPLSGPAVTATVSANPPATTGINADSSIILRNGLRLPRQSAILSGVNTSTLASSRSVNSAAEDVHPIVPLPSPSPTVEMPTRDAVPLPRSSQPDPHPLR